MRKLYSVFTAIAFLLLFNTDLKAQEIGVGIRFSSPGGLTGKFFLDQNQAIEAMLNENGYGQDLVGLYEYHMSLSDPQWRWYFGGGAHISTWSHTVNTAFVGLDGIIGIEYLIKSVPIGVSLDLKPAFDFSNYADVVTAHNYFGLAARYYFKRHLAGTKPTAK